MFKIQKASARLLVCSSFLLQSLTLTALPSTTWATTQEPPKQNTSYDNDIDLFPVLQTNPPSDTSNGHIQPGPAVKQMISSYNRAASSGDFDPMNPGNIFTQPQEYSDGQVPIEYACPLFESTPYDTLFKALNDMSSAMVMNPACGSGNNNYNRDATNNADALKQALTNLRMIQSDPNQLQMVSQEQVSGYIQQILGAVNNISMNLSSNPILNSQCGKSNTGKALLAFNDILSNLSPIALAAASLFPGIGTATQVAMMGAAMVPSAISQTTQYIRSQTIDITKQENRELILKTTCQFMKIYQKMNFLQLRTDDNLGEIKKSANQSIQEYRQKYQNVSAVFSQLMKYKFETERALNELESNLAKDRNELRYYYEKIKSLGTDDERICFVGKNLVQNSMDAQTFPASVDRNIEQTVSVLSQNNGGSSDWDPNNFSFPGQNGSSPPSLPGSSTSSTNTTQSPMLSQLEQDADVLYLSTNKSRKRVAALVEKVINGSQDESDRSIPLCSQEVKSWIKRIADSVNFLSKSINSERTEVDTILSQSSDYKPWNRDFKKIKSEKKTVNTVLKVLREMGKPDAVYIRSELAQRGNDLKNSLFNRNAGFLSKSAVEAWLQNYIDQHQNSVSQFIHHFRLLQQDAQQIRGPVNTGSNSSRSQRIPSPLSALINPQAWNTMVTQVDLSKLTPQSVPVGSRTHEIVCQEIQIGIVKYNQAKDFLGSAQFMCDMIDPIVTDTTQQLVQICRGSATVNSNIKSTLEQYRMKLVSKGFNNSQRSLLDSLNLLKSKSKQLQCSQNITDLF